MRILGIIVYSVILLLIGGLIGFHIGSEPGSCVGTHPSVVCAQP